MLQFVLTVTAAKRLIDKALAAYPAVQKALRFAASVIIAGPPTATLPRRS